MDFMKKDKQWESTAREAYKAQKRRKEYEELEKKLILKLRELSADESSEYGSFRFQRIERKGSIQYSKIPELQQIDLELYRNKNAIISWKLFKY